MIARRNTLRMMGGSVAALALAGTGCSPGPALAEETDERTWLALLGTSLREERDYRPRFEGRLPPGLRGTLYRNGPGLFDRVGYAKKHLLDGDGLVQAFIVDDTGVRYRNRFVRTEKFIEEEQAGAFLYPTWTTLAPEFLDNVPGFPTKSQAGITTYVHAGRLFALDEVGEPYELDLATLETKGEFLVAGEDGPGNYKAHTKLDGRTGEWIILGQSGFREPELHVIVRSADGRLVRHLTLANPRNNYIHDFFASERHIIINLHTMEMSPLAMLAGLKSVTETLRWKPEIGNKVMVIDRHEEGEPLLLDAPAAWMWHGFNAYDRGDEIVADFVGYEAPDHFGGHDPALAAIMEGRLGRAQYPGRLRRYLINTKRRQFREEIIDPENHEFPMVNPRLACHRHRLGYVTTSRERTIFHDGIARIDLETRRRDEFYFGPDHHVGEPVFAPWPDHDYDGSAAGEPGWLLTEGLSGETRQSFLAVFDAENIAAGPVARVLLDHHVPLSFHGYWHAA